MSGTPNSTATNVTVNVSGNQANRLLGSAKGVNMNAVADTQIKIITAGNWSCANTIVTNASTSLTTAAGAVYTAPGAGGIALVAPAALSAATSSEDVVQMTQVSTVGTDAYSGPYVYFRVTTAQGAAATADVYIYGYDLE